MTPCDLARITELGARARADGWTACSADLLLLFRELAIAGRIDVFAECYRLFTETAPDAGAFLVEVTPIALRTYYSPLAKAAGETPTRFAPCVHEEIDQLAGALDDPKQLPAAIEQVVARLHRLRDVGAASG